MSPENLLISEFISYYCKLPRDPEYAVLIKGVWGIGKTKFVHDILEKLEKNGQEHLYVSLYGVTAIGRFKRIRRGRIRFLIATESRKFISFPSPAYFRVVRGF